MPTSPYQPDVPEGPGRADSDAIAARGINGSRITTSTTTACSANMRTNNLANVVAFDQVYFTIASEPSIGQDDVCLQRDVWGLARVTSVSKMAKRPRPIVLRVNEGDCLQVNFTNC